MLRLLTDENFNHWIVRGLTRRLPQLDIPSVRDVGLASLPDLVVLKWAASEGRIILTHDINTMVSDAKQLIMQGELMTGLVVIPERLGIGRPVTDLELVVQCYSEQEICGRIVYLPL